MPNPSPPTHFSLSDEALLAAWSRGDMLAAKALYRRHFDTVCRFFRNKLSNLDEVADLVAETFLELVKINAKSSWNSEHVASFRAWLLGIARNLLYRHFRRNYCPVKNVGDDFDFDRYSMEELAPRTLSSIVGGRRELDILIKALRTLPLKDQILLEAKHFEYLMDSELATLLELPTTSIRGRLRSAKERLSAAVERLAAEQGRPVSSAPGVDMDDYIAEIRALIGRTNPPPE